MSPSFHGYMEILESPLGKRMKQAENEGNFTGSASLW